MKRETVLHVLRERLERFFSLAPQVLVTEDPETIHDVRVWSRRSKEGLDACFPKPRPKSVRALRRTLRRVRRTLGDWRNCDVGLELAVRKQDQPETLGQAWGFVLDYLRENRANQVDRARRKLVKYDLAELAIKVKRLLSRLPDDDAADALLVRVQASLDSIQVEWRAMLLQAQKTREVSDIHAFRVATKRLRYRAELLRDLGDDDERPLIDGLKKLQEGLGRWHDRQVLHRMMAQSLARPDFLLREPEAARLLLAEMEKDRYTQAHAVDEIFRLAPEHQDTAKNKVNP